MRKIISLAVAVMMMISMMSTAVFADTLSDQLAAANSLALNTYTTSNATALSAYEAANATALSAYEAANAKALSDLTAANRGASKAQKTINKAIYEAQKVTNYNNYQAQKAANLETYNNQKATNLTTYNNQLAANAITYAPVVTAPVVSAPVATTTAATATPETTTSISTVPVVTTVTAVTTTTAITTAAIETASEINMLTYGAKNDGITDNTKVIQAAIDSLKEKGGTLYFPAGVYVCNGVKLYTNITIKGDGSASILQQKAGVVGLTAMLGVNQGGAGTTNPEGDTSLLGTISNITITNITLRGTVEKDGFSEWNYLLALTSCSYITVDQVNFEGYRGDGIFIGVESRTERHVSNVVIKNSKFDGINKNNRNAISIIAGSDILIENNTFVRTSRVDMPGAIDIEPNKNESIAWTIIKNITIRNNTFSDLGSMGIVYSNPNDLSLMTKGATSNIVIEGNKISGATIGIVLNQAFVTMTDATASVNVSILNNIIENCQQPILAQGVRGLNIKANKFTDCKNGVNLGNVGKKVMDVNVEGNTFTRLGKSGDETGLLLSTASRVTILKNTFEDCGLLSATYKEGFAIAFVSGTTSYVTIGGNTVTTPTGLTTMFIYVSSTHVLNASTNVYKDNIIGKLLSSKSIIL